MSCNNSMQLLLGAARVPRSNRWVFYLLPSVSLPATDVPAYLSAISSVKKWYISAASASSVPSSVRRQTWCEGTCN